MRSLAQLVAGFIKTHRYCLLVLYFPLYIVTFFIIEANTPTSGYWVTDLPIDSYIPFVPQFALFYVLWYPLFAVVGIQHRERIQQLFCARGRIVVLKADDIAVVRGICRRSNRKNQKTDGQNRRQSCSNPFHGTPPK